MKGLPKFSWFAAIVLMETTSTALVRADLSTNQVEMSRPAATNSLSQFRSLIKTSNYKLLGLSSTNEAAQLAPGDPLRIYRISLARLSAYDTNQSFNGLLASAPEVIYPFSASTGAVACSILRLETAGWNTASLGQPRLIRRLERLKKDVEDEARRSGTPAPAVFAVSLPFGSIWMGGYYDVNSNAVLYSNATNSLSTNSLDHAVSRPEMNGWAAVARTYSGNSN